MADDQTLGKGSFGFGLMDPIIKGRENLTDADFEIVRLSIGTDTALVGDFVTYRGQITAGTPATHRDVNLASLVNADTQATNAPWGWCGQIIEPWPIPNPVSGVTWDPDTALIDGTFVKILKRGTKNVVTKCILTDQSLDVLTGYFICISGTAGEVAVATNTFTDTTPTTPELAVIALEMNHYLVGMADSVAEDVAGAQIGVDVSWL
jgi:hypothetical protein